jgi:hypothetical protein
VRRRDTSLHQGRLRPGNCPIPGLRGTATCGPWTALVIDDVDGRQPALPWQPADIDRVLTTLDHLADALTPAPVPVPAVTDLYADAFTSWRTLARQPATSQLDPWTRAHLSQLAALEQTWLWKQSMSCEVTVRPRRCPSTTGVEPMFQVATTSSGLTFGPPRLRIVSAYACGARVMVSASVPSRSNTAARGILRYRLIPRRAG